MFDTPLQKTLALLCGGLLFALPAVSSRAETKKTVDFNHHIRPILSENCFFCHGPDANKREADLRLDIRDDAVAYGAIVPGKPDESTLVERVFQTDKEELMPPPKSHLSLTDKQKDTLRQWIAEGAEYKEHWAFIPVADTVTVPTVNDPTHWARGPIDAFVLRTLQENGLSPAAEAPRERWLRRVTFDLTGLPPTLEEIDAFLADQEPGAHERVVDRLLDSSAYAERLANQWLDLARYADTFGYQADRLMHVWPWRDWVIRAFQDNLPYDQFIIWQTAGDLLDHPTRDQILATTFNRLNRQTNEGGSINEEFRIEYVSDRVHTNGTAFLGLTLECARCHDHKYDPISQEDYYALGAFFNSIDESGLYSHFTETAPTPALSLFEGDQEAKHDALLAQIAQKEKALEQIAAKASADTTAAPDKATKQTVPVSLPKPLAEFTFDEAKFDSGANQRVPGPNESLGQALQFTGDDAFNCGDVAIFKRTDPFSISLWVRPAEHKDRMVVFHRSRAAEDAAFRGYELMLYQGKPTFSLIHFWPGNALRVQVPQPLPLNEWTHLTITYDGSSHANGVHFYLNGVEAKTDVIRDKLTRDIGYTLDPLSPKDAEKVHLELAARFRDIGFTGGAIDEVRIYPEELSPIEAAAASGHTDPATLLTGTALDQAWNTHHLFGESAPFQETRKELQSLREQEDTLINQVPQIMVMKDMPEARPAHVLFRGAYDQPKQEVNRHTPERIFAFPESFPRNRLGLAQWYVHDDNPLVSRVAVNRFWQLFFGRGLVGTAEDFGSQGEQPTHPELLDYLCRRFMDSGWNVKALLKEIALSATYRQDSRPDNPKTWTEDPENRLLARGPRHRLPAEQIRDNALAVSGLLVTQVGGEPVNPYELAKSFKPQKVDKGDGLYRRSLYTFWKRTAPPPVMTTFDATSREVCVAKREETATPLQALALLNGPQYVEASRALAQRLMTQHPGQVAGRIQTAFRLCTSRSPEPQEAAILTQLYQEQLAYYRENPKAAKELLKTGNSPAGSGLDPAGLAATTILCKTLFNYDETVTKR